MMVKVKMELEKRKANSLDRQLEVKKGTEVSVGTRLHSIGGSLVASPRCVVLDEDLPAKPRSRRGTWSTRADAQVHRSLSVPQDTRQATPMDGEAYVLDRCLLCGSADYPTVNFDKHEPCPSNPHL